MIKDVKSVEIVHLKGLRICGNGIKYKIILLKNAEELRMEITELLSNITAHMSNGDMHKSQYSNAEELRKYKELLDSGAINEEEYEIKKNNCLDYRDFAYIKNTPTVHTKMYHVSEQGGLFVS